MTAKIKEPGNSPVVCFRTMGNLLWVELENGRRSPLCTASSTSNAAFLAQALATAHPNTEWKSWEEE